MKKTLPVFLQTSRLLPVGMGLWMMGMCISHPIMSIGQGLILLAAFIELFYNKKKWENPEKWIYWMGGIFVLTLFSGIYATDTASWWTEIRIKFPLLFLPLAFSQLPPLSEKNFKAVVFLFNLSGAIVSILSLGAYVYKYENAWDMMQTHINRNGTIDIISHVHHIYFGLFLAFGSILTFIESRKKTIFWSKYERVILAGLALINALLLHLLTSRTGYVTFYIGIFTGILWYIFQQKQYILGIGLLVGAISTPLLMYELVPTFKSRVVISIWDAREFCVHRHLPDGSIAKRLYAWEQMKGILKENIWLGVGAGDLKSELKERSIAHLGDYELAPDMDEARLLDSPHNQYMELTAKVGFLGLICLFVALFLPVFRKKSLLLTILTLQLAATMMTESLLERQWGVAFWVGFLGLLYPICKKE